MMKFSENWLRTFVNPPLASREFADALTMSGVEVELVEPVAPAFDNVVVAEVLEVQKHPAADRLTVCSVNAGGAPLQVVCGAPNVRAGIRVPLARIGARLPGIEIMVPASRSHTRVPFVPPAATRLPPARNAIEVVGPTGPTPTRCRTVPASKSASHHCCM